MSRMDYPWLQHYPLEIPASMEYPNKSLFSFLEETVRHYPHAVAMDFLGKKITYHSLLLKVYRFAHILKKLGVKKGDRVAIMLPNCPQSVIAYYGTLAMGAVVVQVNPLYVERELKHQLRDSGAKVIVALDLLYSRVMAVRKETDLRYLLITSISASLPFPKNLLYSLRLKKDRMKPTVTYNDTVLSLEEWMRQSSDLPIEEPADPGEDLALLQYTGGTTGLAKGVMLTHANLVANTLQAKAWLHEMKESEEKILAALPLFHVYGMTVVMNLSIFIGGQMILLPKFEAGQVLETIAQKKPTLFPGAPTMYIAILHHPKVESYDISSIKACISGSAALPFEVQQRFEQLTGGRLVEGYGLTEASPVTHANPVWGRRKNGTIGLPWPDTECQIIHLETGDPLPAGEIGELIVKGPQVMKGYWNRPKETNDTLQDGWLHTGDIAKMDEEGYFQIIDRKKEMIIAGGFNIYPREVEEVLYEHPSVQEAAVAGVPDEYRGETVKAWLVLKKGCEVTKEELDSYCRTKLAAFKVPRIYEFRDELPKTLVGKVLKRSLIGEEANQHGSS